MFTNSAAGESDQANLEVAEELRKLQEIQLNKVYELQGEVAFLKSLKDLPNELQKVLRRSVQNRKNRMISVIDGTAEEMTQLADKDEQRARKRNRSKVRRQRDKSTEKQAKHNLPDFADINGTLDRMQELDAQNELLLLESQKHKDEIIGHQ